MSFVATSAWCYDFVSNGIYYNILSETDKTVEVTHGESTDGTYSGTVNVPATVTKDGVTYSVTTIGENAFSRCYDLYHLTIPEGIERINEKGIYQCSLNEMVIPASLTTIEKYGLSYLYSLNAYEVSPNSTHFKVVDGVLFTYDGTKLINYPVVKEDLCNYSANQLCRLLYACGITLTHTSE